MRVYTQLEDSGVRTLENLRWPSSGYATSTSPLSFALIGRLNLPIWALTNHTQAYKTIWHDIKSFVQTGFIVYQLTGCTSRSVWMGQQTMTVFHIRIRCKLGISAYSTKTSLHASSHETYRARYSHGQKLSQYFSKISQYFPKISFRWSDHPCPLPKKIDP